MNNDYETAIPQIHAAVTSGTLRNQKSMNTFCPHSKSQTQVRAVN